MSRYKGHSKRFWFITGAFIISYWGIMCILYQCIILSFGQVMPEPDSRFDDMHCQWEMTRFWQFRNIICWPLEWSHYFQKFQVHILDRNFFFLAVIYFGICNLASKSQRRDVTFLRPISDFFAFRILCLTACVLKIELRSVCNSSSLIWYHYLRLFYINF